MPRSLTSRGLILSSIKEKRKSLHWVVLGMEWVNVGNIYIIKGWLSKYWLSPWLVAGKLCGCRPLWAWHGSKFSPPFNILEPCLAPSQMFIPGSSASLPLSLPAPFPSSSQHFPHSPLHIPWRSLTLCCVVSCWMKYVSVHNDHPVNHIREVVSCSHASSPCILTIHRVGACLAASYTPRVAARELS